MSESRVGRPDADPTPADMRAAFSTFYRKSAPRLVAFLRWQGASLPDAAECAQEALARCFQRWTSITHHHAWCRLVASRLYATRVAALEEPVDEVESAAPSPLLRTSADIERFENLHTFLRLIDDLPFRQRQVLAWTYDGATDAEIAAALRITEQAVRANRHKARAALRHLGQTRGDGA